MKKQLFFDDSKLFGRENAIRKYGSAKLVSTYKDGVCSTDYSTGYVFKLDDGRYRMLYMGHSKNFEGLKLFSAISEDAIHFSPERLFDITKHPEKKYSHEIMTLPGEVAFTYEDKHCGIAEERYKLLMADTKNLGEKLCIGDTLYTSSDLINWSEKKDVLWGDGAEPLASVFYNKHKNTHTIIQRPFWGIRCAGYKETADWKSFSEYRMCLNVDSLDERLSEIYGMYAFEYDGMYIGVAHMYRCLESEPNAKYKNGIIDTQLAYSYDGRYWQRCLREPFISGICSEPKYNLIWVTNVLKCDDGSINIYASASELEHGPAFHEPGHGNMLVYKLRCDGFIPLVTEDNTKPSVVMMREKVWHSGELHVNLEAKKATVAVYITDESEMVEGNMLGIARALEGYSHDDCIEFSGDSTDWVPRFKNGKTVDELKGKTLVFELRFEDGRVYSLSGDYTDVFNTEGARYRRFGVLPK